MGQEIEHKFLVVGDDWRSQVRSSTRIVQGYLAHTDRATIRVRIRGEKAYLTLKGPSSGIARSEYEYPIPVADAQAMLDEMAAGPVVVEVPSAETEFPLPQWAGAEVSNDPRYYNVNLAQNPYRNWGGRAEP